MFVNLQSNLTTCNLQYKLSFINKADYSGFYKNMSFDEK